MQYKGTELTPEQSSAANLIATGQDCKIIAPAGSGKTFSLLAGSRKTSSRGLNLSFNKAIADAASKKFAHNIDCRTGHSLAFRQTGRFYSKRLRKLTGATLAQAFDIGKPGHFGTPAFKGYNILETIRRFCYSADKEITLKHAPILQMTGSEELIEKLRGRLEYYAALVWDEMKSRDSTLPITHDFYLKLWALEQHPANADFIIFDEAQDANPVMVDFVLRQSCQKVFAGDPFQQIYSWRGAVNALQTLPFEAAYLTKSFRFGQAIADVATDIIYSYLPPGNRMPAIQGNEDIDSIVSLNRHEAPSCIICRTNKGVVAALIQQLELGKTPYILGGTEQTIKLINGISALQAGQPAFHPDLMLFKTYDELTEYAESPMGGDMAMILSLIKAYGYPGLLKALHSSADSPEQADLTITTCHKAKGLEWPVVRLANDFKFPTDHLTMIQSEEANLLYVAATRALKVLDISSCKALSEEALRNGKKYWDHM